MDSVDVVDCAKVVSILSTLSDEQVRLKEVNSVKNNSLFVLRKYTLNDTGALKKKMKHETVRKVDFDIGREAKNYSNITIPMKSSFFRVCKDLLHPRIGRTS